MVVSERTDTTMEEKLVAILNEMAEYLSIAQMKKLQEVLVKTLSENQASKAEISNEEYLTIFLDAKRIEGCSERTIKYNFDTLERDHFPEDQQQRHTERNAR